MRAMDYIICDDIRNEIGNKFSLMGVFTNDIVVSTTAPGTPFILRLGLFARIQLEASDAYPDSLQLTIRRGDEVLMSMERGMPPEREKRRIVIAAKVEQRFPDAGDYTFEMLLLTNKSPLGAPLVQTLNISIAPEEGVN